MENVSHTQGTEQISIPEKRLGFAKKAAELHDHYESRITKLQETRNALWDKYKRIVPSPWAKPAEFMSPIDAKRYKKFQDEELEFKNKVKETIADALQYLISESGVVWERMPDTGVPGSLSQTNSRRYRSKLDDTYSLVVNWYDYPDDDGQVAESFRESYSARIIGSRKIATRKGIGGIDKKFEKRDFPLYYIQISQQEDKREFKPSNKTEQLLLDTGKKLRERLG